MSILHSNGNYSNSNHNRTHALLHTDIVFCLEFLLVYEKEKENVDVRIFKIQQFCLFCKNKNTQLANLCIIWVKHTFNSHIPIIDSNIGKRHSLNTH